MDTGGFEPLRGKGDGEERVQVKGRIYVHGLDEGATM